MDINDLRSLFTAVGFGVFVALMVWTFQSKRKSDYEAAARLPFEGDASPASKESTR